MGPQRGLFHGDHGGTAHAVWRLSHRAFSKKREGTEGNSPLRKSTVTSEMLTVQVCPLPWCVGFRCPLADSCLNFHLGSMDAPRLWLGWIYHLIAMYSHNGSSFSSPSTLPWAAQQNPARGQDPPALSCFHAEPCLFKIGTRVPEMLDGPSSSDLLDIHSTVSLPHW